jgi:uncharacterized membrane protein HdeD (DUF308 family)
MDRESGGDTADLLAVLGRHWGMVLAFGAVNVLVGLLVLLWPGRTLVVVAVLFGLELIATGILRFVTAFAEDERGTSRVLLMLLGVLSFVVGLYALRHILLTIATLALLLGIYWIVNGLVEVLAALSHRGLRGQGMRILTGVLSIVAGAAVLFYPAPSLLTLAAILGIWLLVFGIVEIARAFRLRSSAAPAGGHVATAP